MRKSNYSALIIAVTLTFASCNVNNEISDNDRAAVRFTAGIGETEAVEVGTRAANDIWASGDAIGIFMLENGTTNISEGAANRQYTTTGSTSFTAASGHEIYYPIDGSQVDFIAYYPYKTGSTLTTPIDVDIATTQTTANQPTFDLLYSNNAVGYSKTRPGAVNLEFAHKLTKLVMNCKAGVGLGDADLEGMVVTIKGMNTKNAFALSGGTLGTAGTPASIIPRTVTNGSAYDAIILPGNYAAGAVTVEFNLSSGRLFAWSVGAVTFEATNEYTYTVTLNRTGVTATGTIAPWTSNDRGGVVAE